MGEYKEVKICKECKQMYFEGRDHICRKVNSFTLDKIREANLEKIDFCSRCGNVIDYHGAFDIDKDHLCWYCFKEDDIRNEVNEE